jgi:hypothetical protein
VILSQTQNNALFLISFLSLFICISSFLVQLRVVDADDQVALLQPGILERLLNFLNGHEPILNGNERGLIFLMYRKGIGDREIKSEWVCVREREREAGKDKW